MGKMGSADNIYGISEKKGRRAFWGFGGESESSDTGFRHSGYYHRYYRGYTEVRREKSKGKFAIERIYTAPWMVQDVGDRAYVLLRIGYLLLAMISCILYVYFMAMRLPSNSCWYVAIPGMPALAAIFLLCAAVVGYIARPRKMTLWDHGSGVKRLKFAAVLTAALQAATMLAKLIFVVLNPYAVGAELLCALGVSASAAAAYLIFHIEKRIKYREEANNTKLPDGEKHEIR